MADNVGGIEYDARINTSKLKSDGAEADKTLQGVANSAEGTDKSVGGLNNRFVALAGVSAGASLALGSLLGFFKTTTKESNDLTASLTGLDSIANAFGQNADKSKRAAQSLAKDGLMTVSDAAVGLKNLLAAGFSLDDATTLMMRFRDSAAFGRQSALGFGEAIRGATEGIKNGNSMLVDNAGVTKNLSVILTEAGYSAQDLQKASSDVGVRMALFNGILKETNPMLGDAAKLANSAAGAEARLAASQKTLNAQIGDVVNKFMRPFNTLLTSVTEKVTGWVKNNGELTGAILAATVAGTAFLAVASGIAAFIALGGAAALAAAAPFIAISVAIGAVVGALVFLETKFQIFSKLWTTIQPVLSNLAQVVGVSLVAAWNNLKSALDVVMETIRPYMPQITMLAKVIGAVLGAAILGFIVVMGYAVAGLAQLIGWIAQAIAGFINFSVNVWAAMGRFVQAVVGGVNDAIGWFRRLPGMITGAFGDAGSMLFDIGKNIIQGLINGIKNMIGSVKNVAGDVAGAVKDKFKSILGINSPSTVFAMYGKNIVQGLTNGIDTNASMATNAVSSMANGLMVSPVSTTMQGMGSVPINGVSNSSSSVENNIGTINIGSEVDADNLLRRLTKDQEIVGKGLTPQTRYA